MKIFISEADRESARRISIKNIARFYGIQGWESRTNEELLKEINTLKGNNAPEISALLKNYFTAYDNWFEFYQNKKKIEIETGMEYTLDSGEQMELDILIRERQIALDALQEKFDELQLPPSTSKRSAKIFPVL